MLGWLVPQRPPLAGPVLAGMGKQILFIAISIKLYIIMSRQKNRGTAIPAKLQESTGNKGGRKGFRRPHGKRVVSAAGDHMDKKNPGPVRYPCGVEAFAGDVLIINAHDDALAALAAFGQKLGNGEAFPPRQFPVPHLNHASTPFSRNKETTSGKSIPNRFTVARVGMPSFVQPRRL